MLAEQSGLEWLEGSMCRSGCACAYVCARQKGVKERAWKAEDTAGGWENKIKNGDILAEEAVEV